MFSDKGNYPYWGLQDAHVWSWCLTHATCPSSSTPCHRRSQNTGLLPGPSGCHAPWSQMLLLHGMLIPPIVILTPNSSFRAQFNYHYLRNSKIPITLFIAFTTLTVCSLYVILYNIQKLYIHFILLFIALTIDESLHLLLWLMWVSSSKLLFYEDKTTFLKNH